LHHKFGNIFKFKIKNSIEIQLNIPTFHFKDKKALKIINILKVREEFKITFHPNSDVLKQ